MVRTGAIDYGGVVQDALPIHIEAHFDLRNATRRRRDAVEVKRSKILVIAAERTLALQYLDLHARLIVAVGRKDLRLTRRDSGVTWNHRRSHATCSFDRQSK